MFIFAARRISHGSTGVLRGKSPSRKHDLETAQGVSEGDKALQTVKMRLIVMHVLESDYTYLYEECYS